MDVYLLPRRSGEYFLHAGELVAPTPEESDPSDSKTRKLWAFSRKAYHRLTRARRMREALLSSLGAREPLRIRILHPSSLSETEARRIYADLIARETQKHKKWMVASTAAIPLAVPLTLIPGPNVLLAYLAWRSVVHYKTKKAGERASAPELAVTFVPEPRLDELVTLVKRWPFRARRRIRELGHALGLPDLDRAY